MNLDPPGADESAATGAPESPQGASDASPATAAPPAHTAPGGAPSAPTVAARTALRDAATAVLAAWGDDANRTAECLAALDAPMAALRLVLAGRVIRMPRNIATPRKPREGTKQQAVRALLSRAEGATVAQIADATNRASHTVRGFLAGLKKKGHTIEVLDRVKMVGPNKEGAKGSYTVYRVAAPVAA